MLTVKIHNDGTGSEEIGNYDVTVDINGKIVWRGRVEGFERISGWWNLVSDAGETIWEDMMDMEDG